MPATRATRLIRTRVELAEARSAMAGRVGLVPTMGALHEGHLANIAQARRRSEHTVVSIFVNPLQFDQAADLTRYPRTLAADLELCEQAGVDLVWAPEVAAVYRGGQPEVRVTAGPLAEQLEGPNRPGHFDGVLTVVTKLFASIKPDLACLRGEGLPAADPDPPAGAGSRPAGRGGRECPSCETRTVWRYRVATCSCPPRIGPRHCR